MHGDWATALVRRRLWSGNDTAFKIRAFSIACVLPIVLSQLSGIFQGILFPWHPVLMSIGFLGLMTEGVLAAVGFRALEGSARTSAIIHHAYVQLASIFCIALGFLAIYSNKNRLGKEHFVSLHAKVGLVTFVIALLVPIGGAFSFRRLGLITKLPERWQPHVKWAHRSLGLLVWSLALAVVQLPLPHPAIMQGTKVHFWRLVINFLAVLMFKHMRERVWGQKPSILPDLQMNALNPKAQ